MKVLKQLSRSKELQSKTADVLKSSGPKGPEPLTFLKTIMLVNGVETFVSLENESISFMTGGFLWQSKKNYEIPVKNIIKIISLSDKGESMDREQNAGPANARLPRLAYYNTENNMFSNDKFETTQAHEDVDDTMIALPVNKSRLQRQSSLPQVSTQFEHTRHESMHTLRKCGSDDLEFPSASQSDQQSTASVSSNKEMDGLVNYINDINSIVDPDKRSGIFEGITDEFDTQKNPDEKIDPTDGGQIVREVSIVVDKSEEQDSTYSTGISRPALLNPSGSVSEMTDSCSEMTETESELDLPSDLMDAMSSNIDDKPEKKKKLKRRRSKKNKNKLCYSEGDLDPKSTSIKKKTKYNNNKISNKSFENNNKEMSIHWEKLKTMQDKYDATEDFLQAQEQRFSSNELKKLRASVSPAKWSSSFVILEAAQEENSNKLELKTHHFVAISPAVCKVTTEAIAYLMAKEVEKHKRPKSLLCIVNPFGGKGIGHNIYRQQVAPLFRYAVISTEVHYTEYQNHAKEIVVQADLSKYDGIVCVGGDGTLNEVIAGVMEKKSDIHIGSIPGGSTNCFVYTACGKVDLPVTSALHIILGNRRSCDIASVYLEGKLLRYAVTMLSYGFYGNIMKESEKYRWMGPSRYDYAGFQQFLSPSFYKGKVMFKRAEIVQDENTDADGWTTLEDEFICCNVAVIRCECPKCPSGMAPCSKMNEGIGDVVLVRKCSRPQYLQHLIKLADETGDHFDFDFVQHERITEIKYEASEENKKSCWNIDGELVLDTNLHFKFHKSGINLFAPPWIE